MVLWGSGVGSSEAVLWLAGDWGSNWSGSSRWARLGSRWRNGAVANIADHLLGLGAVITNVLLGNRGSTSSVLSSERLDLVCLLVGDVLGIVDVVVDKLLVVLVDQWREEYNGGSNQRQAPEWNNLDKVV